MIRTRDLGRMRQLITNDWMGDLQEGRKALVCQSSGAGPRAVGELPSCPHTVTSWSSALLKDDGSSSTGRKTHHVG